MEEPLISVIVPVYNVEKYIIRCIDSIINQTYRNLEIILIDDGSPDNCPQICDHYVELDNRVKVIHKKNGGLSSARNAGLDIIKGQYVTFVDSDDFLSYEYITKLYSLCKNNDCQIAQCSFEKGSESEFSITNEVIKNTKYNYVEIFSQRSYKVTVWAKLYDSSLFLDVRFPIGKINEDEFVTYKVIYKADNIMLTDEILYYYYQSPDSIMRNNNEYIKLDFLDAYNERIQYFREEKSVQLVEISIKELCIQLMLCYIKCKGMKINTNNSSELLKKYKHYYSQITHSRCISAKEKMILFIFKLLPHSTAYLVNKLRLR